MRASAEAALGRILRENHPPRGFSRWIAPLIRRPPRCSRALSRAVSSGDEPGPGWAAIFTNPASEDAVAARLRRGGWRCYLPRYRRLLRGVKIIGGRRVRVRGPGEIVMRPLFSRYLFAEIDLETQAWSPIANCVGVNRLVLESREVGSRPALIHPEVIEAIRQAVSDGDFDDVRPTAPLRVDLKRKLDQGERPAVRVNGYGNLIGALVALDDNGRAQVLLNLLGGETIARTEAACNWSAWPIRDPSRTLHRVIQDEIGICPKFLDAQFCK